MTMRLRIGLGAGADSFTRLAEHYAAMPYAKGAAIFGQSDPPNRLCFVKRGIVKLAMVNPEGEERTIRFCRSGDIFGECAIFSDRPHGFGATAFTPAAVVSIPRDDVLSHFASDSEFALDCARVLAEKLWVCGRQVAALCFESQASQVVGALISVAREAGEQDEAGMVRIPLTHQELANYMGASRARVTGVLADLEARGLVAKGFKEIVIPSLSALRVGVATH